MKRVLGMAVVALAVLGGAVPAGAVEEPAPSVEGSARATIAVMDLVASNASAADAAIISNFVRMSFVRLGVFSVVDKKNMDRVLQEQAFQQTGCTSQECAVKLGKLLNTRKIVVGEYSVMAGISYMTAQVVDVESGRIDAVGKEKGFKGTNADAAADRLVRQLVESMGQGGALRCDPRVAGGRFGLGVNFPGIGLRYFVFDLWAVEAIGQAESGVVVAGGRLCRYFGPLGRVAPYVGIEGDVGNYKSGDITTSGWAGMVVGGIEYFVFPKFSVQVDVGPAYATMTHAKTDISASGIEFVVNLGLTYYP